MYQIKITKEKKIKTQKKLALISFGIFIVMLVFCFIGTPHFRLVGASKGNLSNSIAIVEDTETGKQAVLEIGDTSFGGMEVLDIKDGIIEISYNNEIYTLSARGIGKSPAEQTREENQISNFDFMELLQESKANTKDEQDLITENHFKNQIKELIKIEDLAGENTQTLEYIIKQTFEVDNS